MIGYKFMGKAHSNAWRQVSRFFAPALEPVMKVVCGRNEEEVKKAAETFGWQEYATSWEEVIARKDIDVVDICTPGDTHLAIAIAAAEAKKVVFCEKPLANSVAESQRMLDAVESAASSTSIGAIVWLPASSGRSVIKVFSNPATSPISPTR